MKFEKIDVDLYAPKKLCNMIINPVILTGGSGSRLWPISRKNYPKPFIRLTKDNSNHSFLQTTVQRLDRIPDINDPIIVCNESHGVLVSQQLSEINRKSKTKTRFFEVLWLSNIFTLQHLFRNLV